MHANASMQQRRRGCWRAGHLVPGGGLPSTSAQPRPWRKRPAHIQHPDASRLLPQQPRTRMKSLPRPWYLANLMDAEQTTAWRRAPLGAAAEDMRRCCRELHRCCCGRNARTTLLAARDCAIAAGRGATTSGWPGGVQAGPASGCSTAGGCGKAAAGAGCGQWAGPMRLSTREHVEHDRVGPWRPTHVPGGSS